MQLDGLRDRHALPGNQRPELGFGHRDLHFRAVALVAGAAAEDDTVLTEGLEHEVHRRPKLFVGVARRFSEEAWVLGVFSQGFPGIALKAEDHTGLAFVLEIEIDEIAFLPDAKLVDERLDLLPHFVLEASGTGELPVSGQLLGRQRLRRAGLLGRERRRRSVGDRGIAPNAEGSSTHKRL